MASTSSHPQISRSGFTLIELIVVIAVIATLIAFATPAALKSFKGIGLAAEGDQIQNALVLARQKAMTENKAIQFRFYKYSDSRQVDSNPRFTAYQTVRVTLDDSGTPITEALAPPRIITSPLAISELSGLSTLVDLTSSDLIVGTEADDNNFTFEPGGGNGYDFTAFQFFPDGTCSLPIQSGSDTWHLTLTDPVNELDGNTPKNFLTVRLDTATGATTVLRPQ